MHAALRDWECELREVEPEASGSDDDDADVDSDIDEEPMMKTMLVPNDDNANDQSNLPKTDKRKDRGESGDDGAHKKQRGENEPAGEDQPAPAEPAHPEPATEPTNPLTPLNLPEDSDAEEKIDVGGGED